MGYKVGGFGLACGLGMGMKTARLLLKSLIQVTTLGKPYSLLYLYIYIPVMVTEFKFLNSNPGWVTASTPVLPMLTSYDPWIATS